MLPSTETKRKDGYHTVTHSFLFDPDSPQSTLLNFVFVKEYQGPSPRTSAEERSGLHVEMFRAFEIIKVDFKIAIS